MNDARHSNSEKIWEQEKEISFVEGKAGSQD